MNWERFNELRNQLANAETELDEILEQEHKAKQTLERAEKAARKFPELKKAGNGLLILSVLLVIAEVILLFTGWNFSILDVLIIGLPVFFGLRKKITANKELQELKKEYPTQEAAIADITRWEAAKKELSEKRDSTDDTIEAMETKLEQLVVYKGKQWDIANIKIDNTNRAKIEEDAVAYLCYIAYTPAKKLNLLNEWWCDKIGLQRMLGKATDDEYERFNQNLANSGSWILRVCRRVIQLYDLSASSALKEAFGGARVEIPVLSDILKKDGIGPAETELEHLFITTISVYAENLNQDYDFGDLTYFY